MSSHEQIEILLDALPYIKQFAGKIVLIKYGGSIMRSESLRQDFATDIALLKYVGMNPVIVHGGGPDISVYMKKLKMPIKFVQGLRVTDGAAIEVVKMVLRGKVNPSIVNLINTHGVTAVGLSGEDGKLILAKKRLIVDEAGNSVDLGFVGEVVNVNTEVMDNLEPSFVPVIASLGVDEVGNSYNINADEVAAELAVALKAEKAIFLTDVEGIYRDLKKPKSLISEMTLGEAEEMLSGGNISKGMIPKVRGAIRVLETGEVHSAHIIDGRVPHAVLLEIFTKEGVGTKVIQ